MPASERAERPARFRELRRAPHAPILARRAPPPRSLIATTSSRRSTASPLGPSSDDVGGEDLRRRLCRRDPDAHRVRERAIGHEGAQRRERGEVAGVVAGERGDACTGDELAGHGALVDRAPAAAAPRPCVPAGARRARGAPRPPPRPRRLPRRVQERSGSGSSHRGRPCARRAGSGARRRHRRPRPRSRRPMRWHARRPRRGRRRGVRARRGPRGPARGSAAHRRGTPPFARSPPRPGRGAPRARGARPPGRGAALPPPDPPRSARSSRRSRAASPSGRDRPPTARAASPGSPTSGPVGQPVLPSVTMQSASPALVGGFAGYGVTLAPLPTSLASFVASASSPALHCTMVPVRSVRLPPTDAL